MPKATPRHAVVRLPLNAERPIGASVSSFAVAQPEPEFDMHYGLEMGVVLQGCMRRWSGDATYDLERGQPWFVGMWEPHGAQAIQAPCRVLVVTIWPPLLAGMRFAEAPGVDWMRPFACEHTAPVTLDAERRKELLRLAAELASTGGGVFVSAAQGLALPPTRGRAETSEASPGRGGGPDFQMTAPSPRVRSAHVGPLPRWGEGSHRLAQYSVCAADEIARSRLRLLLLETLLLVLSLPTRASQPLKSRGVSGGIAPALELALSQQRPIRVDEAARRCRMSRERFMRAFRSYMGLSFAQFALRHRLNGAAAELMETDAPIKALAWRWGFTDESHFHRHFVRHYRCTPKDYRKRGEG